jgi:hypothetical protein
MTDSPLERWHEVVRTRNPALLNRVLAQDATFHSPVVFRPQQGRDMVALYLTGAMHVLVNQHFRYVRQIVDGAAAALEFETEIDGVHVNGVDLITWDEQGQIGDFKVMIRPLKAVTTVRERMAAMLERL